jgi:enoyl-CoA hydratase
MNDQMGKVHLTISDGIAAILIDRPEARNAMTWPMYESLAAICRQLAADSSIKVATFRGAGGDAFVAGTDIEQFVDFKGADAGVAYEKTIDEIVGLVERLPMPTIAIVEGWAIGGGLAICTACDFRVATPEACFGVPIARTLGNCLSMSNTARLVAAFGVPRAKRMLLLAETITAGEAESFDFVTEIAEPSELDATVARLCKRLAGHAAVTMRVSKEAIRRVVQEGLPQGEDLIRAAYGSADFKIGVDAFMQKKRPEWTGA